MKNVLKVVVKEGHERDFEVYCEFKNIFCKAYDIHNLRNRYRAECKVLDLIGARDFIITIEPMPMMTLS